MEARLGSLQTAREILVKGIAMNPNYTPLYHSAALIEGKLGDLQVNNC